MNQERISPQSPHHGAGGTSPARNNSAKEGNLNRNWEQLSIMDDGIMQQQKHYIIVNVRQSKHTQYRHLWGTVDKVCADHWKVLLANDSVTAAGYKTWPQHSHAHLPSAETTAWEEQPYVHSPCSSSPTDTHTCTCIHKVSAVNRDHSGPCKPLWPILVIRKCHCHILYLLHPYLVNSHVD